jgi:hypothetical protein
MVRAASGPDARCVICYVLIDYHWVTSATFHPEESVSGTDYYGVHSSVIGGWRLHNDAKAGI